MQIFFASLDVRQIGETPGEGLPDKNCPPDSFYSLSCALFEKDSAPAGAVRGSSPLNPRKPFEKGLTENF